MTQTTIGHGTQTIGHWTQTIGHWTQSIGRWAQPIGRWTQTIGHTPEYMLLRHSVCNYATVYIKTFIRTGLQAHGRRSVHKGSIQAVGESQSR